MCPEMEFADGLVIKKGTRSLEYEADGEKWKHSLTQSAVSIMLVKAGKLKFARQDEVLVGFSTEIWREN